MVHQTAQMEEHREVKVIKIQKSKSQDSEQEYLVEQAEKKQLTRTKAVFEAEPESDRECHMKEPDIVCWTDSDKGYEGPQFERRSL